MLNFKKYLLQAQSFSNFQATALLLLRVVVGVAFILHGSPKIQSPMAWMPETAGLPGILQLLAAVSEFGGGIAILFGLLTRVASLGLGFTMIVATAMHAFVMKDPFVNMTGGSSYELALGYAVIALLFLAMGPGQYSLDKKLFGER